MNALGAPVQTAQHPYAALDSVLPGQDSHPAAAEMWSRVSGELRELGRSHPIVSAYLWKRLGGQQGLVVAFIHTLCGEICSPSWIDFHSLSEFMYKEYVPSGFEADILVEDIKAIQERDPACKQYCEALLFYKGFVAIGCARFSHWLWRSGQPAFAKLIQKRASDLYGIDIHPAAVLGKGLFIDHGTGIVIGETAVVGNDVSILHGVTLGGTGKDRGKRHPNVGNGVLIGAHATILGNIDIGDHAKIGACSVVLKSVRPRTTVAGVPARLIREENDLLPSHRMDQDFDS